MSAPYDPRTPPDQPPPGPPPQQWGPSPAPPPQQWGTPPQQWGPPPSSGGIAWGLGLLVLVPFPFVSSLAAGLVMILVGRAQRRHGPVAAANGRHAANWGVTYLAASVVLIAAHILLLYLLTRHAPSGDFFPIGIPLSLLGVLTIAHVVICFVGLTRANRGAVLRVPAFPFFG